MRKMLSIMLAGLLFCACVPIQPEPNDGFADLASALATMDENPDPSEYLELLLKLDPCVRDEMVGEGTPKFSEEESVALTIYMLGALMAARSFERQMAIKAGVDVEDPLSSERVMYDSLVLAGQGCEGIESVP